MKQHADTCMCLRCCIAAAARAAKTSFPKDPERQRRLVDAYCRGLNDPRILTDRVSGAAFQVPGRRA